MAQTAPSAWLKIHVQPHVACMACLLANFTTPTLNSALLFFGSGPLRWTHHPFAAVYAINHYMLFGLTWRKGPDAAVNVLAKVNMMLAISTEIPLVLFLLLGPVQHCPFTNRLAFTLVNSFAMWTWTFAALCGNWSLDHPPQPHRCSPHLHPRLSGPLGVPPASPFNQPHNAGHSSSRW